MRTSVPMKLNADQRVRDGKSVFMVFVEEPEPLKFSSATMAIRIWTTDHAFASPPAPVNQGVRDRLHQPRQSIRARLAN